MTGLVMSQSNTLDSDFNGTVFKNNDIQITSVFENCNDASSDLDMDYVILTLENLSEYEIRLEFDQELYYDESCKTCNSSEYRFSYLLKPGEKRSGSCGYDSEPGLRIFHGMSEKWVKEKLSKFELVHIKSNRQ